MNRTESYINKFYKSLFINSPDQLTVDNISVLMDVEVLSWKFSSAAYHYKGKSKIFLSEGLTHQQKWQDFGHEICHVLIHAGRQGHLPISFLQLQENQAEYFSYHFCIPTFMLQKLKEVTIYDVMNLFNVEFDFAYTRLEMYESKMIGRMENARSYS
ncbi:ImmA/IrrE family metallo-endopeptidase [Virgibacillus sp. W0430]|uniref:ImmA/IrrE family metallo-endopeptidase n=1 Tax=Virgibacillus sp. W0430 TaxID=3391580 RepID=UPI003F45BBBD